VDIHQQLSISARSYFCLISVFCQFKGKAHVTNSSCLINQGVVAGVHSKLTLANHSQFQGVVTLFDIYFGQFCTLEGRCN